MSPCVRALSRPLQRIGTNIPNATDTHLSIITPIYAGSRAKTSRFGHLAVQLGEFGHAVLRPRVAVRHHVELPAGGEPTTGCPSDRMLQAAPGTVRTITVPRYRPASLPSQVWISSSLRQRGSTWSSCSRESAESSSRTLPQRLRAQQIAVGEQLADALRVVRPVIFAPLAQEGVHTSTVSFVPPCAPQGTRKACVRWGGCAVRGGYGYRSRSRSTTTGAWSEAPLPLRSSRST